MGSWRKGMRLNEVWSFSFQLIEVVVQPRSIKSCILLNHEVCLDETSPECSLDGSSFRFLKFINKFHCLKISDCHSTVVKDFHCSILHGNILQCFLLEWYLSWAVLSCKWQILIPFQQNQPFLPPMTGNSLNQQTLNLMI